MLQKPWRGRFTKRLASRVSRVGTEDAAPRQRLFPYEIADTRAEPQVVHKPTLVVSGGKKKIVAPERKVEPAPGWQFKKR